MNERVHLPSAQGSHSRTGEPRAWGFQATRRETQVWNGRGTAQL